MPRVEPLGGLWPLSSRRRQRTRRPARRAGPGSDAGHGARGRPPSTVSCRQWPATRKRLATHHGAASSCGTGATTSEADAQRRRLGASHEPRRCAVFCCSAAHRLLKRQPSVRCAGARGMRGCAGVCRPATTVLATGLTLPVPATHARALTDSASHGLYARSGWPAAALSAWAAQPGAWRRAPPCGDKRGGSA